MHAELDKRTCRRCRYCEPCEHGVQIGMLLHGRSLVRRMGVEGFLRFGGQAIVASVANCIACGDCIERCPYQLPIPELIKEVMEFYAEYPELQM